MMTEPPSSSSYSDIFLRQVINSLRHAIDTVRDKTVLNESSRDHALHIAKLGLQHPQAWSCTRELLLLLNPIMEQAGWREDWILFLNHALSQAITQKDWYAIGECHFWLGILWQRLAKYPEAEKQFRASSQAFETIADTQRKGRGLIRTAFTIVQQRRFQEGSLLAEASYPLITELPLERGYYYLVLEYCAREQQDHHLSYELSVKSLSEWEQTGDFRVIGWGLNNLAYTLFRTERYEEAKTYHLQALEYLTQVDDPLHVAIVQLSLGNIYLMNHQYREALDWYAPAVPVVRHANELSTLMVLTNSIGMAYHEMGNWQQAEAFYLEGIGIAEQINNIPWTANVRDNLALTYTAQNAYQEAIAIVEHALSDLERNSQDASFTHFHTMLSDTHNSITILRATEIALAQNDYTSALALVERRLADLRTIPNSNNYEFFFAHLTELLEFIRSHNK